MTKSKKRRTRKGSRARGSRNAELQGQLFTILITVGLVSGLFATAYLWDPFSWFGAGAPEEEEETPVFTFRGYDYYSHEEVDSDETDFDIYGKDVSDLTEEEKEDLTTADFKLKASKESGDTFEPDEKYFDGDFWYYVNVTGTDYNPWFFVPTTSTVNTVYLMNETTDVGMSMISEDEYANDFTNTTYDEWIMHYTCLDGAEGTGSPQYDIGYKPWGNFSAQNDFENGPEINNHVLIKLVANTTWDTSWSDLPDMDDDDFKETVDGTLLYYEIDSPILGTGDFKIDLSSDLNDSFNVSTAYIGYGTVENPTFWDSYTT